MTMGDSLSNRQVNYRLEEILKNTAEQNPEVVREMERFPFCIVYGKVSKTMYDTLEEECNMQSGSESAGVMMQIPELCMTEEVLDEAVQRYRKAVETGNAFPRKNFLFAVIFMADQFRADGMRQFVQILRKKCRKKGMEGNYRVVFYCIFDYENMDAALCRKEMETFFASETDCSVGFVSPDNMYDTEFQRYWKGLQVIALHVFLQCSVADGKYFQGTGEAAFRYFTLGYWKLDVLKQLLSDHLITALEMQRQAVEKTDGCRDMVMTAIDSVVAFDANRFLDQFEKLPVLYPHEVEELFKVKWLGIKKSPMDYEELLIRLYGRPDAFTQFLTENLGEGGERERVETFFSKQKGTLYFVKNRLTHVLEEIGRQCEREREECADGYQWNGKMIFDRQTTPAEVRQRFREVVWERESRVFLYTRRLKLIHSIQEYMKSLQFREKLEQIEKRNAEQCNQLKVLRREIAWNDAGVILPELLALCGEDFEEELLWDTDPFEKTVWKNIGFRLENWDKRLQEWMGKNTDRLLNSFLEKIEKLKREEKLERFYTTRLNVFRATEEKEYLYLNSRYVYSQDLLFKLPCLRIKSREWQRHSCVELLCIKEVSDLAQIYGMS